MPIYSDTNALRVVENDTSNKTIYAPNNDLRVTVVSGATYVGPYAADGSLNVKLVNEDDGFVGPYDAVSGALRIVQRTTQIGLYAKNSALLVEGVTAIQMRDGSVLLDRFNNVIHTRV